MDTFGGVFLELGVVLRAGGIADVVGGVFEFDDNQGERQVLLAAKLLSLGHIAKFGGVIHINIPSIPAEISPGIRLLN